MVAVFVVQTDFQIKNEGCYVYGSERLSGDTEPGLYDGQDPRKKCILGIGCYIVRQVWHHHHVFILLFY